MSKKFRGQVEVLGDWIKITSYDMGRIAKLCQDYGDGKRLIMSLEDEGSRSSLANNFYWGVIVKAFQREWPDYSKDEVHRVLGEFRRERYSPEEIEKLKELRKKNGGTWGEDDAYYIKSTSDMNAHDFWAYVENCKNHLFWIGGKLELDEGMEYARVKEKFGGKIDK